MALAIDGTPVTATATATTGTLITLLTNDIVVLVVMYDTTTGEGAVSVSSIATSTTSGTIGTFVKRKAYTWTLNYQDSQLGHIEVWWAATSGATPWVGHTTTLYSGSPDNTTQTLFAVNGVGSTSTPWDANISLPATNSNITSTASLPSVSGVSTTNAATMLLGFACSVDNSIATTAQVVGTNFTTIIANVNDTGGAEQAVAASEYAVLSSAQTSITGGFGNTWPGWGMVIDALAGASSGTALKIDMGSMIELLSSKARDGVILENTSGLRNDIAVQFESASVIRSNNSVISEELLSNKLDSCVPFENRISMNRDAVFQIESLSSGAIRIIDGAVPLESFSRLLRDSYVLSESLVGEKYDNSVQLENSSSINRDTVYPNEFLSSEKMDIVIPSESLGTSVKSDSIVPLEFVSRFMNDVEALLESTTSSRFDSSMLSEFLSKWTSDFMTPAETIFSMRRDVAAPLESTGATLVKIDGAVLLESLSSRFMDNSAITEFLAGIQSDSALNLENLMTSILALYCDSAGALEMLAGTGTHNIPIVENLAGMRLDSDVQLENVGGFSIKSDATVLLENLSVNKFDAIVPLENTGNVILKSDITVPLEFSKKIFGDVDAQSESNFSVRTDNSFIDEFLAGRNVDIGTNIENLSGLRRDSTTQTEFTGTIALRIDGSVPIEAMAKLFRDTVANVENTSLMRLDFGKPLEALSGLRNDVELPSEALEGIRRDIVLPVEFKGSIAYQSDAAVQLEFSAKLSRDNVVDAEATIGLLINEILQNETSGTIRRDSGQTLEALSGVRRDYITELEITTGFTVNVDGGINLEWLAGTNRDGTVILEFLHMFQPVQFDCAFSLEILSGMSPDALVPIEMVLGRGVIRAKTMVTAFTAMTLIKQALSVKTAVQ
jgi:hypothetical protein